jgi:hypothetical protein
MRYEVKFTGLLVHQGTDQADSGDVEAFVDTFVAELEEIDAEDIDVSTNIKDCAVSVSISLEAEDLPSAQVVGGGTIRTAFHAAGAATPEWSIEWVQATTVPEDDSEADPADTDSLIDA